MKAVLALVACLATAATVAAGSSADVTKLTLALSESSPYSYVSGTTLYLAPTGSNSGSFTVTATAKADGDIEAVTFPAAFGVDELDDDDSPYAQTYSWTASSTAPGALTVKATEEITDETKTATFTVIADTTGPAGQTVGLSGGPGYSTLSVPLTLTQGTDSGAGVDSGSGGVVERASAPLTKGACGAFGTFAAVTLSGGADTSVVTGNCYRYQYKAADRVGNLSATASAPSAAATVDTTPPSAPSLVFTGLTNASVSGSVVYVRGSGAGSFTVSAVSSDAESGVQDYTFPTIAGYTAIGTGPSRTYSFAGPGAPAGPVSVTATNGTGLSSGGTAFSIAADAGAPTLAIRCNGRPCSAKAYPKGVTVTLTAADSGGSGVDAIRYTFDGTTPTVDHGAEYEGPFIVRALTRLKARAFDNVGNPSSLFTATIRSLADRFVFAAPSLVTLRTGAKSLSARVSTTKRVVATATMTGPRLKKPKRWQFVLAAGASIVQLRLPEVTKAGRYAILWSVQAGPQRLSRTTRVVYRAKPKPKPKKS